MKNVFANASLGILIAAIALLIMIGESPLLTNVLLFGILCALLDIVLQGKTKK